MSAMADSTDQAIIADRTRGIAREASLTQADVARIIGVERKAVVARMSARVPFTAAELGKLAKATRRPIGDFYPSERVS